MPQIAVILPVHNRARTIGRAVASVLGQTLTDFELIVVDDGSIDGSAAAAAAADDPRVRIVSLDRNRGANAARNAGIRAANAPLVAFLDSDDIFLPHKLGAVVAEFARRPELDLLVDSYVVERPDRRREQRRINRPVEGAAFVEALFQRRLWKATPAISARRVAVLRAGLFDEQLQRRQDFDFLVRASRVAHCAASDQLTWVKTWSADAISAQHDRFIDATIELCRRHPEYLADPRFYDGLARDVARQFMRLARARQWRDARSDLARLRGEFGTLATLRMLGIGWREGNVRKRAKHGAEAISAGPAPVPEADRSGGSAHS